MLGFLRRRAGHGRLGAAVTAIPSAPLAAPPAVAAPVAVVAARPELPVEPELPVVPHGPARPLVQLGFRDGTSAELDPASAEARALDELARLLTRGR